MYQEEFISSVWIEGLPKNPGLYLIRFDNLGNNWLAMFHVFSDDVLFNSSGKLLFGDHISADYSGSSKVRHFGKPTHHCKATAKNFSEIIKTFVKVKFNKHNLKWEKYESLGG